MMFEIMVYLNKLSISQLNSPLLAIYNHKVLPDGDILWISRNSVAKKDFKSNT